MPELYGMPERYSRISPRDSAAREIASEAVDWPTRFRAAADAAERHGWVSSARDLRNLANDLSPGEMPSFLSAAIGRALLGEDA